MYVQITGIDIEVGATEVIIEALNIENMVLAKNLFDDVSLPTVKFAFDRNNTFDTDYFWSIVEKMEAQTRGPIPNNLKDRVQKLVGFSTNIKDKYIC